MASLDTSLGWVNGDVERILLALEVGVSNYTINELTVCCNELGGMSGTLVNVVRGLLTQNDSAVVVQKNLGVEDEAGRVLVKADVLEWEVERGGRYEAVIKEKGRVYNELSKIFAFCSIGGQGMTRDMTVLVRS